MPSTIGGRQSASPRDPHPPPLVDRAAALLRRSDQLLRPHDCFRRLARHCRRSRSRACTHGRPAFRILLYALMQIPIGWLSDAAYLRWLYALLLRAFRVSHLRIDRVRVEPRLPAGSPARAARYRRIHLLAGRHEEGAFFSPEGIAASRLAWSIAVRATALRLRRPAHRRHRRRIRLEERVFPPCTHVAGLAHPGVEFVFRV